MGRRPKANGKGWLPNRGGTGAAPPADPEGRDMSQLGCAAARVSRARKAAEKAAEVDRVPTFEDFERAEDGR